MQVMQVTKPRPWDGYRVLSVSSVVVDGRAGLGSLAVAPKQLGDAHHGGGDERCLGGIVGEEKDDRSGAARAIALDTIADRSSTPTRLRARQQLRHRTLTPRRVIFPGQRALREHGFCRPSTRSHDHTER